MQRVGRAAGPRLAARRYCGAGALLLGLAVAGCSNIAQPAVSLDAARGTAIAFESIEGPPPAIVQKFVRDLGEEARARELAMVPRGAQAAYRIRGYLAAHGEPGAPAIAWAWDVYDPAQRRAFRLTGEERGSGRQSWAAADDDVLRRIARTGMDQLVAFIATARAPAAPAPEPAPAPGRGSSVLAVLDDFTPEASGIFHMFRREPAESTAETSSAVAQSERIPLPRNRPPRAATSRALAFANPARGAR